jgi:hypothetical protein
MKYFETLARNDARELRHLKWQEHVMCGRWANQIVHQCKFMRHRYSRLRGLDCEVQSDLVRVGVDLLSGHVSHTT